MIMHNIMEEFVEDTLDSLLKHYDCCKCAKCRKDMMAVALNNLPPHYIVTDIGETISKALYELAVQRQAQITAEVTGAVEFVKTRPRHDTD